MSDHQEGPFTLLGKYNYSDEDAGDNGIFNDAGVLVDDDGRVHIYYGFTENHYGEIDPADMRTIIPGSYRADMIPRGEGDDDFFEASSPRKINGKYYLIYSPRKGSRLFYAISDSPTGPFRRMGAIIDNGVDYPAGNDHGSVCCINGQWYIFYHRMTNGSIMQRQGCVERIEILPDGTIPQVEMTSLGFEESLSPYRITPAEIACVLKGGCFVTEKDIFTRVITGIKTGSVIGYRYFDFGEDFSGSDLVFKAQLIGAGCPAEIHILLDSYDDGEEIGVCRTGTGDGVYTARCKSVTGRHAVYFRINHPYTSWAARYYDDRALFELKSFVFCK